MTPTRRRHRFVFAALLIWALAMIVPDLLRVVEPLGAYGFSANNDGLIYDVVKPFDAEGQSPAWNAGVRDGDRLDMSHLRCFPYVVRSCSDALAVLGGRQLVLPGRPITLHLLATDGRPAREVKLIAKPSPSNPFERFVITLDQIAGILVVVAAGWLVWTRPGPMSWGFFLYVIWFNPGQMYAFFAIAQQWPPLLLAQNGVSTLAEAAGYMGLILFVLRAPNDKPDPKWQWLERALPAIGLFLSLALMASYGALFDYRSELGTRIAIFTGFVVAMFAVAILLERRRRLSPEQYQRLRWVIWGCVIGLPVFTIAELGATTTIFETRWGDLTPSEDVLGLLYLVNGILCLFVFEAIRRQRVVSVAIPLRRVTILGLTLSIPALILHHKVEYMQDHLAVPNWAWIVIGAVALYLISRLHEQATHLTDRYFNRELDRIEHEVGGAILKAKSAEDVDRLLAEGPFGALKLTSAASFRANGSSYRRWRHAKGWGPSTAKTLPAGLALLSRLGEGRPFDVGDPKKGDPKLPEGLARPILGVPASNALRCFALSLYGPHESGTDLDSNERAMLARLSHNAAAVYAELESEALRGEVAKLERELLASGGKPKHQARAPGKTH